MRFVQCRGESLSWQVPANGRAEVVRLVMKRLHLRNIYLVVGSMVLGYAAWILPRVLIPGPVSSQFPLLIHFSTDPERANFWSLLSLGALGFVLGILCPKSYGRSALLAAATALPIVVLGTVEGTLGLASHSLYGIELFMYGLFTIPAILSALLGSFVAGLIVRGENRDEN